MPGDFPRRALSTGISRTRHPLGSQYRDLRSADRAFVSRRRPSSSANAHRTPCIAHSPQTVDGIEVVQIPFRWPIRTQGRIHRPGHPHTLDQPSARPSLRDHKRRLKGFADENAHPLVRLLHRFRCDAEGVVLPSPQAAAEVARLRRPASPHRDKTEQRRRADARLQARKKRNSRSLIVRIYHGDLAENESDTEVARQIREGFDQAQDRDALLDMLGFIESESKLLESARHARGVIQLARDAANWIRPLEQWRPRSHNPNRQFSSLARHLWAVYGVPVFMDVAWLQGTVVQQQWFRHIGAGKNIRTAQGIPISLTKRMAHCFLEAPDHYSAKIRRRPRHDLWLGPSRLPLAHLEPRCTSAPCS